MGAVFRALALVASLLVAFFSFLSGGDVSAPHLVGGLALAFAFYVVSTFVP